MAENVRPGAKLQSWNDNQKLMWAGLAVKFLLRKWFVSAIQPVPDRHMTLLLLNVCYFSVVDPLHKKSAGAVMAVEDVKTSRKYITQAEQLGLIATVRSSKDKRRELLYPTEELKRLFENEITIFVDELSRGISAIVGVESFDEKRKWKMKRPKTHG